MVARDAHKFQEQELAAMQMEEEVLIVEQTITPITEGDYGEYPPSRSSDCVPGKHN